MSSEPETDKPFLVWGGLTEEEARQKGLEIFGGVDFVIKRLKTRDLAKASQIVKYGTLERTHSLKSASKRSGHDRSIKRLRHKRTW